MPRPRKNVDLNKLEALAAMRLTIRELAAGLGISASEFADRRVGRGHDGEFRNRYYAGRSADFTFSNRIIFEMEKRKPGKDRVSKLADLSPAAQTAKQT